MQNTDLASVQVASQLHVQTESGSTTLTARAKKRARNSLGSDLDAPIENERASTGQRDSEDVLVRPSEGHTDDTHPIDEVFMTIRDLIWWLLLSRSIVLSFN